MAAERIVPHKTRVRDDWGAEGMVIGVVNARRRLLGIGMRVDVPAKLVVILDSGRRVERLRKDVTVVSEPRRRNPVSGLGRAPDAAPDDTMRGSLTTAPGDECDRECCA